MSSREFGHRTGHIDLLDYDQAMVEGIGAVFNAAKNSYALDLVDARGDGIYVKPPGSDAPTEVRKAVVRFKQAEMAREEMDLPSILFIRDDFTFDEVREWSPTEQYRVPAPGATRISIGDSLGWSAYETKPKEWPFNLTYTIEVWSRYRTVAQVLLQIISARYPPRGSVTVTDGDDNERVYHTFQEGTADLTEINSLVDRIVGFSLTVRVEGELTQDRVPVVLPGFTGSTRPPGLPSDPGWGTPGGATGPFDPNSPNPGPGGLYGDGQPLKRVTVIGADE